METMPESSDVPKGAKLQADIGPAPPLGRPQVRQGADEPGGIRPDATHPPTPGERDCPHVYEDLTETEAAVIDALRQGRKCETSWNEFHRRNAWDLIEHLSDYADEPDANLRWREIASYSASEHETALLVNAAVAVNTAITFLVNRWKEESNAE